MDWSQEIPTIEGYYLRYNISRSLIFLKDMHAEFSEYPSGLYFSGESGMIRVDSKQEIWWLGPMPDPPEPEWRRRHD